MAAADDLTLALLPEEGFPKQARKKNRSRGGNGVNRGIFYVAENIELETRIELATNSLEDCIYIENKDEGV
jgi:hypothetical protein